MTSNERAAYYQGAKALYESFAIKLTNSEDHFTLMAMERDNTVRHVLLDSRAYLYELLAWAEGDDDTAVPPHPRVRRITSA